MSLTKLTASLAIISALSDLPNATDGLTAAQLKAKYDEAAGLIKTYLNNTLTVELDAAISAAEATTLSTITVDLTVNGEWAVATMAASCAFGEVLYLSSTGYNKAKADADSTLPSVGMCIETGTGARKVLKKGYVKNNAWSWTVGQLLYVSTATAGAITSTLPATAGSRVQIIGYAEAPTIIFFNPDYTFVQV